MTSYATLTSAEHRVLSGRVLYRTAEVAIQCGLTYRMLDYWTRSSELLVPSYGHGGGSGSRRLWTDEDVARIQKAATFALALAPVTAGGARSSQGVAVETIERFVREATEFEGGWRWVTEDFDLRVG